MGNLAFDLAVMFLILVNVTNLKPNLKPYERS
jgi:hypothetical protein